MDLISRRATSTCFCLLVSFACQTNAMYTLQEYPRSYTLAVPAINSTLSGVNLPVLISPQFSHFYIKTNNNSHNSSQFNVALPLVKNHQLHNFTIALDFTNQGKAWQTQVHDFCRHQSFSLLSCDRLVVEVEIVRRWIAYLLSKDRNFGSLIDDQAVVEFCDSVCLEISHAIDRNKRKKCVKIHQLEMRFDIEDLVYFEKYTATVFINSDPRLHSSRVSKNFRYNGGKDGSTLCHFESLKLRKPLNGHLIPQNANLRVQFEKTQLNATLLEVCVALNEIFLGCFGLQRIINNDMYLEISLVKKLPLGKNSLLVAIRTIPDRKTEFHPKFCRLNIDVVFEVYRFNEALNLKIDASTNLLENGVGDDSKLVLVTAINEEYYRNKRIQNLVGSIHFWEPFVSIIVYDIGLGKKSIDEIKKWQNVELRKLQLKRFPPHFQDLSRSYSFKPWILYSVLQEFENVFWIDANIELRRSLDEIRIVLDKLGVFFTIQRPRFPNPTFHHPSVVNKLGCKVANWKLPQIPAGIQAYRKSSWAYKEVLIPLVHCALKADCICPIGTSRSNHRQDQTILNSIICAKNISTEKSFLIQADEKYWLSSHVDDGYDLQPTLDETEFNSMVLYTRREHPYKPYLQYVKYSK